MQWNWQRADWPRFRWDKARLLEAEAAFLRESGVFTGVVKHLGDGERVQIVVEAMSAEALSTSEIEGEMLNRASVQSSIRRQLGMAHERRKERAAERGVAEVMVDLYRRFGEPLSEETVFGWHAQLMSGRRDLRHVGRYRTGGEPMQVVSGPLHEPRVYFEAPPAERLAGEMAAFFDWFRSTGPGGAKALPALTRAGVAHLYFECIHPFEDGNGRIGRAISEKALAEGCGEPSLIALATTILERRKAYYAALEAANRSLEITAWLVWFAEAAIEAQRRAIALVEFTIRKTRLLDGLRGQLNARQEKALLRMLREGPEGFRGGMSAGNYMSITGAATATATRDLADLVEKGALVRSGERRHARYRVALGG